MCKLEFKANDKSKEASKTGDKVLKKAPIVYVDADILIQEILYVCKYT